MLCDYCRFQSLPFPCRSVSVLSTRHNRNSYYFPTARAVRTSTPLSFFRTSFDGAYDTYLKIVNCYTNRLLLISIAQSLQSINKTNLYTRVLITVTFVVLIGDFNALISEIVLNARGGTIVFDQWFGHIIITIAKPDRCPVKPQNKQKCYS